MNSCFLQGNFLTPQGLLRAHVMEIRQGRIHRIFAARRIAHSIPVQKCQHGVIVPGFIDLQVNPVGDCDFSVHGSNGAIKLAKRLAQGGCTGYCASFITNSLAALKANSTVARTWTERDSGGAILLGTHLEGPFINAERRGIHPREHIRPATARNIEAVLKTAGDSLRMVTLAPEISGGLDLVRRLAKEGVVASVGHSCAGYDRARMAFDLGAKSVTHLFNACTPFHHREPGIIGAALLAAEVVVQIIPDGIHVHPSCVDLTYRLKGPHGMIGVTDALAGNQKRFVFAEQDIRWQSGRFENGDGTLAGSSLTMAQALANLSAFVETPLQDLVVVRKSLRRSTPPRASFEDLVQCLSLTPARLLGLGRKKGSLEIGKDADMVWLDSDGQVQTTWIKGEPVYVRDHRLHRV